MTTPQVVERRALFGRLQLQISQDDEHAFEITVSDGVEPYSGARLLRLRGLEPLNPSSWSLLMQEIQRWQPEFVGYLAVELTASSPWEDLLNELGFSPFLHYLEYQLTGKEKSYRDVRKASIEDLPFIQDLSQRVVTDILAYPGRERTEELVSRLEDRWPTQARDGSLADPTLLFLVSEQTSGRPDGYIILDFNHSGVWIDDLAVAESARGGGVARSLLWSACAEATKRGARSLRAMVASTNPRSWKSALRVGFTITSSDWLRPHPTL